VSLPHATDTAAPAPGWPSPARTGASANEVTDDQFVDALSGNAALNGVPVRVEAVSPAPAMTLAREGIPAHA
jgi:hypothetical protein